MRKILLKHLAALKKVSMLFAVCALGTNMTAQTLIAESFEDPSPLPPGWGNAFGSSWNFLKHSGEASHGDECLRVGTQQSHGGMYGLLSTPPIALTAGQTIKLSFDYTVTDIDDNGGDMKIYIHESTNINVIGNDNYVNRIEFTEPFPYTTFDLTFTAEETKDYYITFYVYAPGTVWPNVANTKFKFLLDRVIVENLPLCAAPNNIVVTETTPGIVNLDWNAAGTETAWEVQITNGDLPSEGNWIAVTASQKEVNVIPGRTYSAYVRSKCTGGGYSSFYGPKIFTVSCPDVITAPYTIPFAEKDLPGCWQRSGDTNWAFSTYGDYAARDAGDHSIFEGYTQYAWVDGSYNKSGKKAILLSPKVNVSGLTSPAIEFYAYSGNNNNGVFNELLVEVSNGTTWQTVATIAAATNGWKFYSIDLGALNITNTAQVRFTVTGNTENEATFYNDILIDDVSFREKTTCLPLTNFTTGIITDTSIQISWDAVNTVNTWDIAYTGYGDTFDGIADTTGISNTHIFNELESSTLYAIYIRSNCGNGNVGEWTGPYYVTTDCSLNVPNYREEFKGQTSAPYNSQSPGLPKCWTEALGGDTVNGPSEYGNSDWKSTPDAAYASQGGGSFTNSETVSIGIYGSDKKAWLIGPLVDLSGGVYEAKVKVAVNISTYISSPVTIGSDDKIHMLYTENGTTWNILKTWTTEDNLGSAYDTVIVSLEGITGQNVRFAFMTDEGVVVDNIQYRFHVDDLIIREKSICTEAVNLFADGITHDSAKLSWKNQGIASSWKIAVVPAGVTPTEWQTVTNNPYPAGGLTANTNYDFYVRSVCGGIESEVTTGPFKFQTRCAPVMAPYTETFVEYYEVPACWTLTPKPINTGLFMVNYWTFTTEAKFDASTAGDHTAGGETQYAWLNASGMSNKEYAYLYTPMVNVSELERPAFQFYLFSKNNVDNALNHVTAEIYTGTQWIEVARIENYTNNWAEYTIDLSDYIIMDAIMARFKVTVNSQEGSTPGFNAILIDDVSFIEMPECPASFNLVVTEVTDTTAEVTWESAGTSTSWEVEYGPKGFTPGEGTVVTVNTTPEVTLTDLDDNEQYDVYVTALCTGGSALVGPQTFITDTTSGTGDFNINKIVLYPNPATDVLNLESDTVIDTVEVYNIVGQLVKKQLFNSGTVTVQVSDLSEGIYMVKAFSGKNVGTYKVIKK